MQKRTRKNKTGTILLSILLTASLVSVSSLATATVNCVKVHNLKQQVAELREDLNDAKKEFTKPVVVKVVEPEPEAVEQKNLFSYIGEFKATGYCVCDYCCGDFADGYTASMTKATVGRTVAMNQDDMKNLGIEYGDTIYIDGIGERVVEDTGAFGQGVVDVLCKTHNDCYQITGNYDIYVKG